MKNTIKRKIVAIALIFISTGAPTLAEPKLSLHQLIEQQSEAFIQNVVEQQLMAENGAAVFVDVFPLDERVNVAECTAPYTYELPDNALSNGYAAVKVSCPDNSWYLFINAKIELTQPVVVTADSLSPGTILTQQNLRIADKPSKSLRFSTFAEIEQLLGARIKYRVRPDQPIKPNMVCFVCKGDLITLSARTSGLNISTKGVAQEDGNVGDTIAVMNRRSEKIVLAKVEGVDQAIVEI